MAEATMRYEGRWRVLLNMHPDGPGGVHDDNHARTLGFRRALVPGEAVAEAVMPAIIHRFGTRWMDGGWLSLKMISPTHVDEEVHEIAESVDGDPDRIDVRLETREGRMTCVGQAGLGTAVPWRPEEDGSHGADEAFPDVSIGEKYPDLAFIHDKYEVAVCRDAGGNETPWFRGPSPWGGPVSPPIVLIATALHMRRAKGADAPPATLSELFAEAQAERTASELRRMQGLAEDPAGLKPVSGMQVQHDIVVYRPMFQETPYIMSAHVADKGISASGRTWFRTVEFEVRNGERTLFARGRSKGKTLLEG